MLTQMPMHSVGTLAGMQAGEPAEDIACELLDGLNSLPVECVSFFSLFILQKWWDGMGMEVELIFVFLRLLRMDLHLFRKFDL